MEGELYYHYLRATAQNLSAFKSEDGPKLDQQYINLDLEEIERKSLAIYTSSNPPPLGSPEFLTPQNPSAFNS